MRFLIIFIFLLTGCAGHKFDVPASANTRLTGTITVDGDSMNLPSHVDMVMDWDGIRIGRIVSNKWPGESKPIIHRVVAPGIVDKDCNVLTWRTRGDNNKFIDPYHVWPETYRGTVR